VYENRVLRKIFGPKRDEVMAGWGRPHNEELHNLGVQVKEDEVDEACNKHDRDEKCIKTFGWKT
jgi:hypothetical protein